MILAVDVGNSNTTVGLFNGTGELLFRALLETSRSKTRDQCAIELLGVFQLYGADACTVDGAILSSVVPPLNMALMATPARTITEGVAPRRREMPSMISVVATPPRNAQSVTSMGLLMVSAAADPEPVFSCDPAPSQMMDTAAPKDAP